MSPNGIINKGNIENLFIIFIVMQPLILFEEKPAMRYFVLLSFALLHCIYSMGQKLHIDYSLMTKTEKYVTNLEMRTLEWSRLHRLDSLKTIVPADYLGIFSSTGTKRNTQKDALTYSDNFVLRSYEVDNLVTYSITPDVVIVSYEMIQDGENANGVKWPSKVSATATYVKRNNRWYCKFYREAILQQ